MTPLRAKVATIAAAALGRHVQPVTLTGYNDDLSGAGVRRQVGRKGATLTGMDVLEGVNFEPFAGKRVGLITNQTGLDRQGRRNIDVMRAAGVNVAAIFSPEHGFLGKEDRPREFRTRPTPPRTSRSSACTARRTVRRRRCCTASMCWCSTYRTWASAFTPS